MRAVSTVSRYRSSRGAEQRVEAQIGRPPRVVEVMHELVAERGGTARVYRDRVESRMVDAVRPVASRVSEPQSGAGPGHGDDRPQRLPFDAQPGEQVEIHVVLDLDPVEVRGERAGLPRLVVLRIPVFLVLEHGRRCAGLRTAGAIPVHAPIRFDA